MTVSKCVEAGQIKISDRLADGPAGHPRHGIIGELIIGNIGTFSPGRGTLTVRTQNFLPNHFRSRGISNSSASVYGSL